MRYFPHHPLPLSKNLLMCGQKNGTYHKKAHKGNNIATGGMVYIVKELGEYLSVDDRLSL